jgi:hypothetical protein
MAGAARHLLLQLLAVVLALCLYAASSAARAHVRGVIPLCICMQAWMPQPLSALPSAARGVIGAISSAAAASSHTAAVATTAAEDHTLQLGDLATICLGYSGVFASLTIRYCFDRQP